MHNVDEVRRTHFWDDDHVANLGRGGHLHTPLGPWSKGCADRFARGVARADNRAGTIPGSTMEIRRFARDSGMRSVA
jgi:hypothetical protein